MKYNQLSPNLPPVSEIGLGAWQLGAQSGWKNMSEQEALHMVHQSVDLGINFFDTAPNYGLGTGEERLGKALKSYPREKIVVNTKFGHTHRGEDNFRSDSIRKSLEGSLKRLQMDYVDSIMIHNPPLEILDGTKNDHYAILEKLKEEGKIRAYGASLDSFEEIELFLRTTNCDVVEVFFNILHQDAARSFDLARQKQVGLIAKIPLDSGWLTGKYNNKSVFSGVRQRWSQRDIDTRWRLVQEVRQITGHDKSLAQTAIAFCLAYDAIATVIPGNTDIGQVRMNVDATLQPMTESMRISLEQFYQDKVKHFNLPW